MKNIFKLKVKDLGEMNIWAVILLLVCIPIAFQLLVIIFSIIGLLLSGGHISLT